MMGDEEREPEIRRILVAIDASTQSMAALEAAVQLAAEMRAELIGLFVEDSNLLDMADLPITREVGSYTGVPRDFDRRSLERELRALRAVAERALAQAAEHARVPYSFRVLRGFVSPEVLKAAAEADLVTLGYTGWASPGRIGVGSTVRTVLERCAGLVLVARHGLQLGAPVYVVFDGSVAARRGLALARRLALAMGGGVVVLTPDDRTGEADRLAGEASELLMAAHIDADFRIFSRTDREAVPTAARSGQAGALILPAAGEWLQQDGLRALARDVSCPVIVVRGDTDSAPESPAETAA